MVSVWQLRLARAAQTREVSKANLQVWEAWLQLALAEGNGRHAQLQAQEASLATPPGTRNR